MTDSTQWWYELDSGLGDNTTWHGHNIRSGLRLGISSIINREVENKPLAALENGEPGQLLTNNVIK